jgi:hypothetical protein
LAHPATRFRCATSIQDGTSVVGAFVLAGATADLRVTSDGQGGTDISADSAWANAQGGTFDSSTNWSGGFVPGATSIAYFSLNSPTPYSVSGGGTAGAIDVQGDQVTLLGTMFLTAVWRARRHLPSCRSAATGG